MVPANSRAGVGKLGIENHYPKYPISGTYEPRGDDGGHFARRAQRMERQLAAETLRRKWVSTVRWRL